VPFDSFLERLQDKLILELKNVFLSGGFSENEYLFKEVKNFTDSTGRIQLQRAEDWFVNHLRRV
jgi:hypothetical protein